MKVFRVYVKQWDYDTYDSMVVVAESEEEVRNKFIHEESYPPNHYHMRYADEYFDFWTSSEGRNVIFGDDQGEIFIEEVDLSRPQVLCASFNAG